MFWLMDEIKQAEKNGTNTAKSSFKNVHYGLAGLIMFWEQNTWSTNQFITYGWRHGLCFKNVCYGYSPGFRGICEDVLIISPSFMFSVAK